VTTVVVSQPMLFPWVGLFEQIRLADVFVHYDDVAFSKGSFFNRVQLKTAQGSKWLTVPLGRFDLGTAINTVRPDDSKGWRESHLDSLKQAYSGAPHFRSMWGIVKDVYAQPADNLADFTIAGMMAICRYLGLDRNRQFAKSSELGIPGESTQRVLEVVQRFGGNVYVTGHGARNYFDHELFERHGISVEYMDYQKIPYPQLHGAFTPYVTILDLIANCGAESMAYLQSGTVRWREFVEKQVI
jgi:hypothetical protein